MIGLRRIVPAVLVGAALALAASPALAGFSGTDLFLPSVGNRPGNSGSQWHTLLWIHNPTASNLTVRVYFLARNAANPAPPYFDDLVPAGGTVRYPDVITDRFHLSAWGALRITAPAPVLATCRMYNLPSGGADCDTQGQDYVGVPAPFAIGAGRSTQLLGVYQTTPLASSMFRYSFGWVETSGGTVNVRVSAYGEDGSLVAVKDYPTTQGYEARYYDISDLIPNVNETNVRLTVEATGGAGRIVAVGSGVANSSNDGTTFEMRFPDSLLAAGLSAVIHDATLTGDGTAATPLGIANGGVGSPQLASGAVTGQKVAAGAIGTDHLANGAVTKPKLAATGGTNGQVLGTDGSALTWQTPSGFTLPYSGVKNNNADPLFYIVNTGTGPGVRSESSGGAGLYAYSANGAEGVYGASDRSNGYGVLGVAHNGASSAGVYGEGAGGAGVWGTAGTGWGVHGQSATGIGVDGNGGATGVKGVGVNAGAYGVWGIANNGAGAVGVFGMSSAGDALYGASDSGAGAIVTSTSGPGLSAQSGSGVAVDAYSTGSIGVRAECAKPGGTGISAMASGTNAKGVYSSVTGSGAIGVFGGSSDSTGVEGSSGSGTGVSGVSNGTAVFGQSTGGANGVWGFTNSATSAGVRGENSNGYGVVGVSGAGFGVSGYGNSIGIYAHNSYVG
ncbi:MAG TPA: hypothetical protein VLW17_08180, partial [Thermoanaerobaculaceae bacterium]|nr:hypothetical protein [Thermoanaerobaculaceae bacterium]